jgi:hypothetical protein
MTSTTDRQSLTYNSTSSRIFRPFLSFIEMSSNADLETLDLGSVFLVSLPFMSPCGNSNLIEGRNHLAHQRLNQHSLSTPEIRGEYSRAVIGRKLR